MTDRIIPITIDNYCLANNNIEFRINNAYDLIKNPGDYNIGVDKLTIPIMNVPICLNEEYEIWFDSIDKDKHPSRIPGAEMLKIPFTGTFYSVQDFTKKLNDFFTDVLEEYNFIEFVFDNETKLFTYRESVANKAFMKVYIPTNLRSILSMAAISNTPLEPVAGEGLFYELSGSKPTDSEYYQSVVCTDNLYTLQKFKIYTDLPMAPHYSYDMRQKSLVNEKILTDIDYNDLSMNGNSTIVYHPSYLREYSMVDTSPINNFSVWFTAYYSNGHQDFIKVDRDRYCTINLRCIKKVF